MKQYRHHEFLFCKLSGIKVAVKGLTNMKEISLFLLSISKTFQRLKNDKPSFYLHMLMLNMCFSWRNIEAISNNRGF